MARDILEGIPLEARKLVPAMTPASFTHEGVAYTVIDAYCLDPECKCTEVTLFFTPTTEAGASDGGEAKIDLAAVYDYRAHTMSVEGAELSKKQRRALWDAFLHSCEEPVKAFPERHAALRQLAITELPRHQAKLEAERPTEEKPEEKKSDRGANPEADLDIAPSLKAIAADPKKASDLSIPIDLPDEIRGEAADRKAIPLSTEGATPIWRVTSLRELLRGNRNPPPEGDMAQYPKEYLNFFVQIERHILAYCRKQREPTDAEMMDIFSAMRRRPDGASLGPVHDLVWRCACLELGLRPYSEKEFESLFRQLERSARTFRTDPSSRNYIAYLKSAFYGEDEEEDPLDFRA